ncbi:hypothetical protein FB451DRAFT_1178968 [Mycena latifolia]|nr:hypothetical protein FB451DRAFT_1178968 [Mycena latifolia]
MPAENTKQWRFFHHSTCRCFGTPATCTLSEVRVGSRREAVNWEKKWLRATGTCKEAEVVRLIETLTRSGSDTISIITQPLAAKRQNGFGWAGQRRYRGLIVKDINLTAIVIQWISSNTPLVLLLLLEVHSLKGGYLDNTDTVGSNLNFACSPRRAEWAGGTNFRLATVDLKTCRVNST